MATKRERTESIEKLTTVFQGAAGIYLTDFSAINVEKITGLRKTLRASSIHYYVVKNTLARKALERCGKDTLAPYVKGPVGVVVSQSDSTAPAKIIKDFQKTNNDLLKIKAALVDGQVFSAEDAIRLADIPSREVLLSQLLSCLQAPMSNFVGALSGVFTKLVGTLEAVKQQKEQSGQ